MMVVLYSKNVLCLTAMLSPANDFHISVDCANIVPWNHENSRSHCFKRPTKCKSKYSQTPLSRTSQTRPRELVCAIQVRVKWGFTVPCLDAPTTTDQTTSLIRRMALVFTDIIENCLYLEEAKWLPFKIEKV